MTQSAEKDAERDAFVTTVVYHFRRAPDACACGPLPLGSSFADHQWDVFDALRMGRVLSPTVDQ